MIGQIKTFGLITGGVIVGEVLAENNKMVALKHPVWFVVQGNQPVAYPVVPALLPDWYEISLKVKVSMANVTYASASPSMIIDLYEKTVAKMREAVTGIKPATTEDLAKIVQASSR